MPVYSLRSFCLAIAPINVHKIGPIPPGFCPHGEIFGLPLRYGVLFAKISSNVEYEGWGSGAVKLGHDMGYLIPHVAYGPWTPLLAANIAFSKCKVMFGKATVQINSDQAGWWHLYGMFQICADPVPLPIGLNISAIWTTVEYGFSWGDLICGYIRVVADIIFSLIMKKIVKSDLVNAWVLRATDKLYPLLGPALFKVFGFHNYAIIEELMKKIAKDVPKKLLSKPLPKSPLEDLSRAIDKALGDTPVPPPAPSPMSPVLHTVPAMP